MGWIVWIGRFQRACCACLSTWIGLVGLVGLVGIGTKSQIYHFLAELAAAGKALVIISSDMSEVIGMAHRVAVMHQGAIAGFLSGDEITEHEIMRYATGLKAAAA